MLQGFHLDFYVMTYPSYTLSFATPYVDMRFDILHDVLLDLFSISTPISESIVANRVYRNRHVSLTLLMLIL